MANPDQGLSERYEGLNDQASVLDRVTRGDGVFLQSCKFLQYLIETRFSPTGRPYMWILKECFGPFSVGVWVQSNSPVRRSLSRVLRRATEAGLHHRWFLDALLAARQQEASVSDSAEDPGGDGGEGYVPLSVDHLQGIFFIHLLAHALATFLFLAERVWTG